MKRRHARAPKVDLKAIKAARETVNSHCRSTHLIFSLLSYFLRINPPLWLAQGILEK